MHTTPHKKKKKQRGTIPSHICHYSHSNSQRNRDARMRTGMHMNAYTFRHRRPRLYIPKSTDPFTHASFIFKEQPHPRIRDWVFTLIYTKVKQKQKEGKKNGWLQLCTLRRHAVPNRRNLGHLGKRVKKRTNTAKWREEIKKEETKYNVHLKLSVDMLMNSELYIK